MSIVVREAIKQARTDLQLAMIDTLSLLGQLETVERVLSFSPDETLESCITFKRNCADYDVSLYHIGNDLYSVIRLWYHNNKFAWRIDRRNWDRGDVKTTCVGRWESRGGQYWVELWWVRYNYSYRSNNASGSVCNPNLSLDQAVMVMQAKVDRGMFLPDSAIVPMKRVS